MRDGRQRVLRARADAEMPDAAGVQERQRRGELARRGRGGRPVAAGAASVVWAVYLPDDGPTGGFFRDGQPVAW